MITDANREKYGEMVGEIEATLKKYSPHFDPLDALIAIAFEAGRISSFVQAQSPGDWWIEEYAGAFEKGQLSGNDYLRAEAEKKAAANQNGKAD